MEQFAMGALNFRENDSHARKQGIRFLNGEEFHWLALLCGPLRISASSALRE
jgi:hypothetical protein